MHVLEDAFGLGQKRAPMMAIRAYERTKPNKKLGPDVWAKGFAGMARDKIQGPIARMPREAQIK